MRRLPVKLRLALLATLLALGSQSVSWAVVDRGRVHVVQPGDTLSGISAATGVPVADLVGLNQLPDADHIRVGQALRLAVDERADPAAAAAPRVEYVVKPGDTLSRIAAERGLSVAAITRLNELADPDRLRPGQRLLLPTPLDGGPSGAVASGGGPSTGSAAQPPSLQAAGAPAPAGGVGALLEAAAARRNLDPALVKALAWHLSAWRTDARGGSGAVGVMQITAATQEWVASRLLKRSANLEDPADNVELGIAYLAYLVERFGDERQAVAAYVQGPGSVARLGITPATERVLASIWVARERFASRGASGQPALASISAAGGAAGDLRAAVLAAFKQAGGDGRLGVAARNLTTGDRLALRADEVFPSASVNKLPIATEVYRQAEDGQLVLDGRVRQELERMLVQSDNEAANRLLDLVGEARVNATMASLGLVHTRMHNYFSPSRGPVDPGFNQTSPSDAATLLGLLAGDRLVSPSASQALRSLLQRTADGTKLARGLPPGTPLAHKSGWYSGVANDAGIVYAPRATYVVAVFTEGVGDPEAANQAIAAVGQAIFETWRR